MSDALQKAVWLIVGAFISGLVGIFFSWHSRNHDARKHYLVTLSLLGGELERTKEVPEFYDSTLLRTEEAVLRLRPFLCKVKRADLSTFWNMYRRTQSTLKQAPSDKKIDHILDDYCKKHGMPIPKTQREIVEFFHRKLIEIAE